MSFRATFLARTAVFAPLVWSSTILWAGPARADFDRSRYMSPDELRAGMKGFGRTVLSGTSIETFEFEVLSVMTNAFYPKQDVILIRCSGLNLEHSGIIGGMSGSPCYITDETGRERMIGAVAYGWTFNKDPLCGVQPITQMLDIPEIRRPGQQLVEGEGPQGPPADSVQACGGAVDLGELVARVWDKPIPASSCFSIFNDDILRLADERAPRTGFPGLQPLKTPLMVSGGGHPEVMSFLRDVFDRFSMEPVASGSPSAAARTNAGDVRLEPGSVLCIPLVTGDISMDALGTCTEVDGERVLGFGHSLDAQGSIELPLATGMVHTVVPSVMRSNKLGGSLKTVGTLWGDESTGIFGTTGRLPPMTPVEVTIEDVRGKQTYHYKLAQDENLSATLMAAAVMETVYAHSDLPREHTIRYAIDTEFADLGRFRTTNMSSQSGAFGLATSVMLPTATLLNSPFGKTKVSSVNIDVKVQEGARWAQIDQVVLDRQVYKPGEKVSVRVRWAHYRNKPVFSEEAYSIDLPEDLPDGKYRLMVGSARMHASALRHEKPHLFRAESLPELLERLNQLSAEPNDRLFLRLSLPRGGLAVRDTELPDLPSYMRHIYGSAGRSDIQPYQETLVVHYDLPFMVEDGKSVSLVVSRRADQ